MTDEERAARALAVGKRVRPGSELHKDAEGVFHRIRAEADPSCYIDLGYDPTVPSEDSAEALAWLWERCRRVDMRKRMDGQAEVIAVPDDLAMDPRVRVAPTPEEAVARIIAAWPEEK